MIKGSPVEWQGSNCAGATDDRFFPALGFAQRQAKAAKAACKGTDGVHGVCPYILPCREWALERRERDGVWGGMTVNEREEERKQRKKRAQLTLDLQPAADPTPALVLIKTPLDILRQETTVTTPHSPKVVAALAATKKLTAVDPRRKPTGQMARFADARKPGNRLLADVERYLMAQPQDVGRCHDKLHVAEVVKRDFCARAAFRRIKNARAGTDPQRPAPHFRLENIFEEGNRIHTKWQDRFWGMGCLWGLWICWVCEHQWWDESPGKCESCGARREVLAYREVPMEDPEHLLIGHSDGELRYRDALLEIKGVGVGTVRVENPKMVATYTRRYTDETGKERSYLDIDALWNELRTPFPSHLRQGHMYLHLRRLMEREHGWPPVRSIIFIYESKAHQATKEFRIRIDEDIVAEMLESCKDVVDALEHDIAPCCVNGRRRERCAACQAYESAMKEEDKDASTAGTPAAHGGDAAGTGQGGAASAIRAASSGRSSRVARRSDRPGRPGPDGAAGAAHSLGGLLGRAAGNGVRR